MEKLLCQPSKTIVCMGDHWLKHIHTDSSTRWSNGDPSILMLAYLAKTEMATFH